MRRKIRESIGAKTFISMLVLLVSFCVIIYGTVMYFLPKNYQAELESQFVTEFQQLIQTLEADSIENNSQGIVAFSVKNNASVRITGSDGTEVFSINTKNTEETNTSGKTLSTSSQFNFENQTYNASAMASFIAVSQSYDILIKLLPFILIMIVVIAVISAYLYSRYFSKPLIEICGVAKRMTRLDMTWKCDTSRKDEIGVLAISLNEMTEKLDNALNSLEKANERLQQEIEDERKREKQRVRFLYFCFPRVKDPYHSH